MKRTAEVRNDIVTKRLCTISAISGGVAKGTGKDLSETFKYHSNNKCYKTYTHKSQLKFIEERQKNQHDNCEAKKTDPSTSVTNPRPSRRQSIPRPPPSATKDPRKLICTVCGCTSYKKNTDKFRISSREVTVKLITAACHLQD